MLSAHRRKWMWRHSQDWMHQQGRSTHTWSQSKEWDLGLVDDPSAARAVVRGASLVRTTTGVAIGASLLGASRQRCRPRNPLDQQVPSAGLFPHRRFRRWIPCLVGHVEAGEGVDEEVGVANRLQRMATLRARLVLPALRQTVGRQSPSATRRCALMLLLSKRTMSRMPQPRVVNHRRHVLPLPQESIRLFRLLPRLPLRVSQLRLIRRSDPRVGQTQQVSRCMGGLPRGVAGVTGRRRQREGAGGTSPAAIANESKSPRGVGHPFLPKSSKAEEEMPAMNPSRPRRTRQLACTRAILRTSQHPRGYRPRSQECQRLWTQTSPQQTPCHPW